MKIVITEDYAVNYAIIDARIIEVSKNAKAFENEKTAADEQIQAICDGIYEELCEKVYRLANRYKTLCANTGWHRTFRTNDFLIGENGSVQIHMFYDYRDEWYDLRSTEIYYNGKTRSTFKNFVKKFDKENYLKDLVTAFEKEAAAINEDINKKRAKKQEELNKFLGL